MFTGEPGQEHLGEENYDSLSTPTHEAQQNISTQDSFQQPSDIEGTSDSQKETVSNSSNTTEPQVTGNTGHHMMTRAKSGIFKPKVFNVTIGNTEPVSYHQSVQDKKWKIAMNDEYNALIKIKLRILSIYPITKMLLIVNGHIELR